MPLEDRTGLLSELDCRHPTMDPDPVITLFCLGLDVSAKSGSINFAIASERKKRICDVCTFVGVYVTHTYLQLTLMISQDEDGWMEAWCDEMTW